MLLLLLLLLLFRLLLLPLVQPDVLHALSRPRSSMSAYEEVMEDARNVDNKVTKLRQSVRPQVPMGVFARVITPLVQ